MNKYPLVISTGGAVIDPQGGLFTPFGGSAIIHTNAQNMRNGDRPYHPELQYLALLQELVDKSGETKREDRTGTGTYSVFGRQIRFDLSLGFPLLTTKRLFTRGVVAELLWMLSGSTNIKPLTDQGVHIWDEWADVNGKLGPVYGAQWRSWKNPKLVRVDQVPSDVKSIAVAGTGVLFNDAVDQIKNVIESIKTNPNSRRHIVTAWNPAEVDDMALPPCHMMFQFYVEDGKLSCQLYQRSADIFLGVPFNIASYALLTHLIARECNLNVGEFIHTFGDLHLYANHVEQAKTQLERSPLEMPLLSIDSDSGIFDLTTSDIAFVDYNSHEKISGKVSV